MTPTITYATIPFLRGADERLRPGVARHASTRQAALRAAEQLAPFYAGVIVLKQQFDPLRGGSSEPVGTVGDVPQDLLRRSVA